MKFFNIFLLIGVLCCLSVNSYAQKTKSYVEGEEVKKMNVKKKQKITCGNIVPIRVAGFVTNPPFGWVTQEQHRHDKEKMVYINNGYAYDLFAQMAKNLDLKVQNVGYKSYQDALKDLRRGRIDVVTGVYFNKHNLGVGINLLYPSFMENPIVPIFVKGKEKEIKSFADFVGLKGVVRQEEMIYPIIYQQLPKNVQMKQVSGSKKAFQMLMSGEVDYMFSSLYSAEAEARRFKLLDKIHFSTFALINPNLFFAFSSVTECQQLKKQFASELRRLREDKNTYRKNFINYIDRWGLEFKDEPGLEY
ncbi:MAG: transporter substrate-binding domain-containing protein [Alphaproteobacteria bacterium]|nr:transporter substrate-binding domain-containing protein [Alphaproteobacteria bacterium]